MCPSSMCRCSVKILTLSISGPKSGHACSVCLSIWSRHDMRVTQSGNVHHGVHTSSWAAVRGPSQAVAGTDRGLKVLIPCFIVVIGVSESACDFWREGCEPVSLYIEKCTLSDTRLSQHKASQNKSTRFSVLFKVFIWTCCPSRVHFFMMIFYWSRSQ